MTLVTPRCFLKPNFVLRLETPIDMKTKIILAALAAMALQFSACKKGGSIHHTLRYTTDKNAFRVALGPGDTAFTEFGNYVTSITPYSVKAKMNIMMYIDEFGDNSHMISYIDGHDNDPKFEIALYADFTSNTEVHPEPILYSTDMWKGVFKQKQVTFNYFVFVPYYINLEFQIPNNYGATLPSMLRTEYDSINKRTICKTTETELIKNIFSTYPKLPGGYVFGKTDSTWIYNKEGLSLPNSIDRPFGGPDYRQPVIRSNHYTPATVTMPEGGNSIEMTSIVSYNTEGIIQIYAGADNKPYTADDIFTYAPRYWERIKLKLESK